jgi:hypothetical protein
LKNYIRGKNIASGINYCNNFIATERIFRSHISEFVQITLLIFKPLHLPLYNVVKVDEMGFAYDVSIPISTMKIYPGSLVSSAAAQTDLNGASPREPMLKEYVTWLSTFAIYSELCQHPAKKLFRYWTLHGRRKH